MSLLNTLVGTVTHLLLPLQGALLYHMGITQLVSLRTLQYQRISSTLAPRIKMQFSLPRYKHQLQLYYSCTNQELRLQLYYSLLLILSVTSESSPCQNIQVQKFCPLGQHSSTSLENRNWSKQLIQVKILGATAVSFDIVRVSLQNQSHRVFILFTTTE